MWFTTIVILPTFISFFMMCCCFVAAQDIHNDVDLKKMLEKMVVELGAGRLAVSSYLHYTADNCLQHFNSSQTVGQESLNCYSNAYGKRTTNNTSKENTGQKKLNEEQNWHNLCSVWPLLSQCHKKTTVPATDKCYRAISEKHESNSLVMDFRKGTHALRFTDAYLNFHCTDIQRTVGVLEIARPSQLICFKDLQENIKNCTNTAVDRNSYTKYNLTRSLEFIRDCFKEEYSKQADYCLRKNSAAGKVLPYIEEMFISINSHLESVNVNDNNSEFQETSQSKPSDANKNIVPIVDNKIETSNKNNNDETAIATLPTLQFLPSPTGAIKDPFLQDFLTKVMHPEEEAVLSTSVDLTTKSAVSSNLYHDNHQQEDSPPPSDNINMSNVLCQTFSFTLFLISLNAFLISHLVNIRIYY